LVDDEEYFDQFDRADEDQRWEEDEEDRADIRRARERELELAVEAAEDAHNAEIGHADHGHNLNAQADADVAMSAHRAYQRGTQGGISGREDAWSDGESLNLTSHAKQLFELLETGKQVVMGTKKLVVVDTGPALLDEGFGSTLDETVEGEANSSNRPIHGGYPEHFQLSSPSTPRKRRRRRRSQLDSSDCASVSSDSQVEDPLWQRIHELNAKLESVQTEGDYCSVIGESATVLLTKKPALQTPEACKQESISCFEDGQVVPVSQAKLNETCASKDMWIRQNQTWLEEARKMGRLPIPQEIKTVRKK